MVSEFRSKTDEEGVTRASMARPFVTPWCGSLYSQQAGSPRTRYGKVVGRRTVRDLQHHMFPLVPYHALPQLHEVVKGDCPPVYPSLLAAWREIVPAVARQVKDPAFHIKRHLPETRTERFVQEYAAAPAVDADGWMTAGSSGQLSVADVIRFDHGRKTFALYRNDESTLFATDGTCTHGNVHLAGGLVKGDTIECPMHNGRFHLADGSPARARSAAGLRPILSARSEGPFSSTSRVREGRGRVLPPPSGCASKARA